eukprot:Sspe_Gene.16443::Locus_5799_Transcript_1_1_Confidence_1.000_Length_940::g.16443::m.16443
MEVLTQSTSVAGPQEEVVQWGLPPLWGRAHGELQRSSKPHEGPPLFTKAGTARHRAYRPAHHGGALWCVFFLSDDAMGGGHTPRATSLPCPATTSLPMLESLG